MSTCDPYPSTPVAGLPTSSSPLSICPPANPPSDTDPEPPTPRPRQFPSGIAIDESPNFRRRKAKICDLERRQALEDLVDLTPTKSQLDTLSSTFTAVRFEVSDLDGLAYHWSSHQLAPLLKQFDQWRNTQMRLARLQAASANTALQPSRDAPAPPPRCVPSSASQSAFSQGAAETQHQCCTTAEPKRRSAPLPRMARESSSLGVAMRRGRTVKPAQDQDFASSSTAQWQSASVLFADCGRDPACQPLLDARDLETTAPITITPTARIMPVLTRASASQTTVVGTDRLEGHGEEDDEAEDGVPLIGLAGSQRQMPRTAASEVQVRVGVQMARTATVLPTNTDSDVKLCADLELRKHGEYDRGDCGVNGSDRLVAELVRDTDAQVESQGHITPPPPAVPPRSSARLRPNMSLQSQDQERTSEKPDACVSSNASHTHTRLQTAPCLHVQTGEVNDEGSASTVECAGSGPKSEAHVSTTGAGASPVQGVGRRNTPCARSLRRRASFTFGLGLGAGVGVGETGSAGVRGAGEYAGVGVRNVRIRRVSSPVPASSPVFVHGHGHGC